MATVLIVDDSSTVRLQTRQLIEENGLQVIEAANGAEGLEAARNNAGRVQSVRLRLGSLAGVAREALLFSYGIACEGTPLEGSRLLIDDAEGTDLEVISLEIE